MTYSLDHLLKVQTPPIKRHPDFPKIQHLLFDSPKLSRIRLNQRAYRLLNEPRLELRYLDNFYATYRVPKSDFFSLFLSIKWEQVQKRKDFHSERNAYIALQIDSFPRDFLDLFKILIKFDKHLYPKTKKWVNQMSAYTLEQWLLYFTDAISELKQKHIILHNMGIETLLACTILETLPDFNTGKLPSKTEIKRQFRKLSKEHHPDSSNHDNNSRFLLLKKAYEHLTKFT